MSKLGKSLILFIMVILMLIIDSPAQASRSVSSTAYCLKGRMANGQRVHNGAVASKILPRGSRWKVLSGSMRGRVFTVKDTGSKAYFDIWMSSCRAARIYGRQRIQITRV